MRIKNGKELVLRADYQAREDRIRQCTYGQGSVNGRVEYEGCAIGCLGAPHRQAELKTWVQKFGNFAHGMFDIDPSHHRDRLYDEFGINQELALFLEAIFEGLPTHGDAIEFIPEVARAIASCEGREITTRDIAVLRHEGGYGRGANGIGQDAMTEPQAMSLVFGAKDALLTFLAERASEDRTIPRKLEVVEAYQRPVPERLKA